VRNTFYLSTAVLSALVLASVPAYSQSGGAGFGAVAPTGGSGVIRELSDEASVGWFHAVSPGLRTPAGTHTVLPDVPAEPRQAPGGAVSVNELRHPPSAKAIRTLQAAQKAAGRGDYAKSASLIEAAVRLSPDYPAAHSNLAVQYARLRRFEEAESESRRAITLGSPNPVDLCNLAFIEEQLGRIPDAQVSARQCLSLAPAMPRAHYLLGLALAADRRTLRDALPHLEIAAEAMPAIEGQLQAIRQAVEALNRP